MATALTKLLSPLGPIVDLFGPAIKGAGGLADRIVPQGHSGRGPSLGSDELVMKRSMQAAALIALIMGGATAAGAGGGSAAGGSSGASGGTGAGAGGAGGFNFGKFATGLGGQLLKGAGSARQPQATAAQPPAPVVQPAHQFSQDQTGELLLMMKMLGLLPMTSGSSDQFGAGPPNG